MKLINIIGHPLTFMIIYSLLLIEGNEHFGGVYISYVFMGWQEDLLYAKVAATGWYFVFFGYILNDRFLKSPKAAIYFAGLILMVLSLLIFFENGNKSATFEFFIPIMTFTLFAISGTCLLFNCTRLLHMPNAPEQ